MRRRCRSGSAGPPVPGRGRRRAWPRTGPGPRYSDGEHPGQTRRGHPRRWRLRGLAHSLGRIAGTSMAGRDLGGYQPHVRRRRPHGSRLRIDRDDLELYGVPSPSTSWAASRSGRLRHGRGNSSSRCTRRGDGPPASSSTDAGVPSITSVRARDILAGPSERPRIESASEDLPGSAAQ